MVCYFVLLHIEEGAVIHSGYNIHLVFSASFKFIYYSSMHSIIMIITLWYSTAISTAQGKRKGRGRGQRGKGKGRSGRGQGEQGRECTMSCMLG